jgi:hypothetical protein
MNRKLWIVVGVIAIVFLLSNLLPIDGGGLRTEEPARLWADPGSGTSLWDRVAPYLGADLGLLGWILLGLAGVLLVAVVGRALTRTPGKERRQARRLARRGDRPPDGALPGRGAHPPRSRPRASAPVRMDRKTVPTGKNFPVPRALRSGGRRRGKRLTQSRLAGSLSPRIAARSLPKPLLSKWTEGLNLEEGWI